MVITISKKWILNISVTYAIKNYSAAGLKLALVNKIILYDTAFSVPSVNEQALTLDRFLMSSQIERENDWRVVFPLFRKKMVEIYISLSNFL